MIDVAPLERNELQSRLDSVICNLIRMHIGKPCPTRREIMYVSMLPRRKVWKYLADMQARGLIEVEVCDDREGPPGHNPVRRRMRVAGDRRGTDWTARRPVTENAA